MTASMGTKWCEMTYFNPVFQYGWKAFVKECKKGGIDGVIIPEFPLKKAGQLS